MYDPKTAHAAAMSFMADRLQQHDPAIAAGLRREAREGNPVARPVVCVAAGRAAPRRPKPPRGPSWG